jgi:hypothetical protein
LARQTGLGGTVDLAVLRTCVQVFCGHCHSEPDRCPLDKRKMWFANSYKIRLQRMDCQVRKHDMVLEEKWDKQDYQD